MPKGFGKFTHIILDEHGDPSGLVAYVEEIYGHLLGAVWFFDQSDTETTLMDLSTFELISIEKADASVRQDAAFQIMHRVPA